MVLQKKLFSLKFVYFISETVKKNKVPCRTCTWYTTFQLRMMAASLFTDFSEDRGRCEQMAVVYPDDCWSIGRLFPGVQLSNHLQWSPRQVGELFVTAAISLYVTKHIVVRP